LRKTYPSYPAVNAALAEACSIAFQQSGSIQVSPFPVLTEEDNEMAANFDVERALVAARQARCNAALSN
jgi:hypothetical protein